MKPINMRITSLILVLVLFYVSSVQCSECGLSESKKEEMKEILTQCMKLNDSAKRTKDMSTSESKETETSMESNEMPPLLRGETLSGKNVSSNLRTTKIRMRRAKSNNKLSDDSPMVNRQRQQSTSSTTEESRGQYSDQSDENETSSSSEDMCVVQCVYEKLDVTNSKGFPDSKRLTDAIIESVKQKDKKDVIKTLVEGCFIDLNKDDSEDACHYSTQLARCLFEKGRENCSDWPMENVTF
ncbi:general odorant-binding protein 71 [Sitophilus oryzae]|uniref:General odorant-binding protein 71 n=1 Tax=Sitophilus oryzae TaxID=7048 RepID=A0A6J2XUT8_SITOR|nr:general odorant-binding protein 71 [Sitophilus oryzae]